MGLRMRMHRIVCRRKDHDKPSEWPSDLVGDWLLNVGTWALNADLEGRYHTLYFSVHGSRIALAFYRREVHTERAGSKQPLLRIYMPMNVC